MPKREGISETAFASQVEDLFERFDWKWQHQRPARRKDGSWYTAISGHPGFPDYIAAREKDGRLLFAELKDEKSQLEPDQVKWFEVLRECQRSVLAEPIPVARNVDLVAFLKTCHFINIPEVYLWRPSQFEEIARILR